MKTIGDVQRDNISIILADIGDLVVLMAKRRYIQNEGNEEANGIPTRRVVSINQKMICHVFESDEVSEVRVRSMGLILFIGSNYCTFHWSSISSSLCRILTSEWN